MTLSQSLPPVPGLAAQIHESSRQDADIAASVDVPVSADFMSGYGLEPEDVAESVTRCGGNRRRWAIDRGRHW